MDRDALRAAQAPLKDRYQADPSAAWTPLHAEGDYRDDGITCTVEAGTVAVHGVDLAVEAGEFDLLIMGSHGPGTLGNLVMGSVATQVIAQSKVPVLLVR